MNPFGNNSSFIMPQTLYQGRDQRCTSNTGVCLTIADSNTLVKKNEMSILARYRHNDEHFMRPEV
jgi:hypothetical protein